MFGSIIPIVCAAAVLAKSEPFAYYAQGESLSSGNSSAAIFIGSGESVATESSDVTTYKAIGDVMAVSSSTSFSFQAVGEAPVRTQSAVLMPGRAVLRLSANSLLARGVTIDATFDVRNLHFRYWEKLTDEPTYLTPTVVEIEQDGTISVVVEMPPAKSGFLQPVLAF